MHLLVCLESWKASEIAGVGRGVGWFFVYLRCGARDCVDSTRSEARGRRMNTSDFRGAVFWCGVLLDTPQSGSNGF